MDQISSSSVTPETSAAPRSEGAALESRVGMTALVFACVVVAVGAAVAVCAATGQTHLAWLIAFGVAFACAFFFWYLESRRCARLKQSEQFLRQVLENTTDFVSISDRSGNSLFRNSAFHRFLSATADSTNSHPHVTDCHSKNVRGVIRRDVLPAVLRDGIWTGESQLIRSDGEPVPVSEVIVGHRDPVLSRITHFSMIARDLTPQKAVEESLRESRKFIEHLADSSPSVLFIYDHVENRLVYANKQLMMTMGYKLDDLKQPLSELMATLIHPDDRKAVQEATAKVLKASDNKAIPYEFRARTAKGNWVWLDCRETVFKRDDDGTVVQTMGSALDITKRKEAEQVVIEDRERFSTIISMQREIMHCELDSDRVLVLVAEGAVKLTESAAARIDVMNMLGVAAKASVGLEEDVPETTKSLIEMAIDCCCSTGEMQYMPDVSLEIAKPKKSKAATELPIARSLIVFPLLHEGIVTGCLTVLSTHKEGFKAAEIEALQTLAGLVATALSRGAVFESRQALLSERTAAIDRLQESEERFRAAIEAVHEAMILRDQNGKVMVANASAERILRFPVSEMFNRDPQTCEWTLIRDDRSEIPTDALPDMLAIKTGQSQPECILGIERVDGTVTWLSVKAAPLFHFGQNQAHGAVMTFSDITERKAAFDANARLAAIVDSSQDGILGATLDGVIVSWNPGAERLFGYSTDEMLGRTSSVLTPPNDTAAYKKIIKKLLHGEGTESVECIRFRKDGVPVHVSMTYSLIHNSAGEPIGIAAIARDITDRVRYEEQIHTQMQKINEINVELQEQKEQLVNANEQLAALATLDGLSGLKNHRVFQERLQEEFQRAARYGTPLSLFLLDVDQFKTYNDAYGHPAGDEVLRTIAKILTDNCRSSDMVARYGGEEFVVILPQTPNDGARVIAERCRRKIEAFKWPLREVTASFGINSMTVDIDTAAALIAGADQALYYSKAHGKNRVSHARDLLILDSEMDKAA